MPCEMPRSCDLGLNFDLYSRRGSQDHDELENTPWEISAIGCAFEHYVLTAMLSRKSYVQEPPAIY